MKKSAIALFLILSLCLTFLGCTNDNGIDNTTPHKSTEYTDTQSQEVSSTTEKNVIQQAENPTESTTLPAKPIGGSEDGLAGMKADKYRYNYYRVTSDYIDIVGTKAYHEWLRSNPIYDTRELEEMLMVSYIKHFNITREQFDKASQKRLELFEEFNMEPNFPPYEYEEDYDYEKELYEVYNADIIYTFDNELINEYYTRPPELIVENGTNALGEKVD